MSGIVTEQGDMSVARKFESLGTQHRWWISVLFVLMDLVALELSVLLGVVIRNMLQAFRAAAITSTQYEGVALGVLALPLAYFVVGLYPGNGRTAIQHLRARVYSTSSFFLVLLFWDQMTENQWSRGILLGTFGFALILLPVFESLVRHMLVKLKLFGNAVLIMGAGRTGTLLARIFQQAPELGFNPVAFLDDDRSKWGEEFEGIKVMGPISMAPEFVGCVRTVVLAMPSVRGARLSEVVAKSGHPRVILIPDLFGIQSLWAETRDFSGVLGLEVKNNLLIPGNRAFKRVLDYVFGIPLFLLSLPILGLLALAIRFISPGSPFYCQDREGFSGRTIRVWKLRTMRHDADQMLEKYLAENPQERETWEQFFKLKSDPRVLPLIGTFLRRTSLDELPQLWNVLKGEMSLVGPRPFPLYHLGSFSLEFRSIRNSVLPGLTGLWQTQARSDGDLRVQEALDTYYIRNWSLWMDLHILARTIGVVVMARGAY